MNMTFRPNIPAQPIQTYTAIKTFAEAAASYIEHGGDGRYMAQILARIGNMSIDAIHPFDIREPAKELLPDAEQRD